MRNDFTPPSEQLRKALAYEEFKYHPQPAHKTIQHMMDEFKLKTNKNSI